MELDQHSSSATFYDEIEKDASGDAILLDRWFEWEDSSDDPIVETWVVSRTDVNLYSIGDAIQYYDATRQVRMNMPLPQSDMFERCDFSSAATFYSEVDVECEFVITSTDECTTILSASTYADLVVARYGTGSVITTTTIGTSSTSPATSGLVDCTNTLSTLKFEFYFDELSAGFRIDNVVMDYEVDAAAKSVGDVVTLHFITKFYRQTNSTIATRSGNPGYLATERLLLASTVSGATELTGFRKDIASTAGECLADNSTLTTITENYLEFMEDVNMQCNLTLADAAAFEAQCTDTAYQSLYMFNQFTMFGRYGTAQTSDSEDWTDIITQAVTTSPTYDATTLTCQNMITTIQYEVIVSYQGYEDNLQMYVDSINAKPLQEDVTYVDTTSTPGMPYRVIFTNYLVMPDDIRNDDKIPYEFPPDLGTSSASTISRGESSNSDEFNMS